MSFPPAQLQPLHPQLINRRAGSWQLPQTATEMQLAKTATTEIQLAQTAAVATDSSSWHRQQLAAGKQWQKQLASHQQGWLLVVGACLSHRAINQPHWSFAPPRLTF